MKNKNDVEKSKIARLRIEQEPEAMPHREGARQKSPYKDLGGLIQPSYSQWASGIVMVKRKTGEILFCCDYRPLNDVTVKDAFPLPRIDGSLSRFGNAKT